MTNPAPDEYLDGDRSAFLAGRDADDLFPWSFHIWSGKAGESERLGSITTPNGRRRNGTPHTYWMVTGQVWEPDGRLICHAVNGYMAAGWRGRLIRWLSRKAS